MYHSPSRSTTAVNSFFIVVTFDGGVTHRPPALTQTRG
jgi:hypothetical protein